MAKRCDICGKGPLFGHNVSHSQRKTAKRWNVNIQKTRVIVDGTPKTINICTKCIKSNKVVRAI